MDVSGAIVVVTGASSGIGAATARAAAQAGAKVALLARRKDRVEALTLELSDALALGCDVTEEIQRAEAISAIVKRFGRIDVLVNNAGQGLQVPIEKIALADFRDLLELNIVAPLAMMQAVIPIMREHGAGSIINVSSGATLRAMPGSAAYTSSKAALNMLSDVARAELAEAGIVVSTILPFITNTEFYDTIKAGSEAGKAIQARSAAMAQTPEQVASKIIELITSGDARADLVPEQFGGSYRS